MEYDPEEYEPQEHDEIAIKVLALVKNEVKSKISETLDSLNISKERIKILSAENQKLRAEARNAEPSIRAKIKESEKVFKREIFGGFTIGDKVYYAKGKYNYETCQRCSGTGSLEASLEGNKIFIKCVNKCSDGKIGKLLYSPELDKIRSIHLEMHDDRKFLNCYLEREDSKREMAGIFKTTELCQAYCDEKNKPKEE